jgi:hypothetical protein
MVGSFGLSQRRSASATGAPVSESTMPDLLKPRRPWPVSCEPGSMSRASVHHSESFDA